MGTHTSTGGPLVCASVSIAFISKWSALSGFMDLPMTPASGAAGVFSGLATWRFRLRSSRACFLPFLCSCHVRESLTHVLQNRQVIRVSGSGKQSCCCCCCCCCGCCSNIHSAQAWRLPCELRPPPKFAGPPPSWSMDAISPSISGKKLPKPRHRFSHSSCSAWESSSSTCSLLGTTCGCLPHP